MKIPEFIKKLTPRLYWRIPGSKGAVYLTFDDGPTPGITQWVLDTLDRFDAKATFFCLGKNVDLHPDILPEILRRGHAVGNHTYSHQKGWGMPAGRYVEDVDLANDLLHSNLFRPPYGRITPSQIRRLRERYRIIMWDIISRDYSHVISGRTCVKTVTKHLYDGAIIVFHDSVKAAPNLRYALPRVLEEIRRQGYSCRPIEL